MDFVSDYTFYFVNIGTLFHNKPLLNEPGIKKHINHLSHTIK